MNNVLRTLLMTVLILNERCINITGSSGLWENVWNHFLLAGNLYFIRRYRSKRDPCWHNGSEWAMCETRFLIFIISINMICWNLNFFVLLLKIRAKMQINSSLINFLWVFDSHWDRSILSPTVMHGSNIILHIRARAVPTIEVPEIRTSVFFQ